ncbi:MAG: DsrE family protein [Candidatus Helarchaeota archaeon]|nr:DsrE family protein [Candidatus Helarchaeota archaeon]
MAKLTVMILESPYGRERPYTALRFALTALIDGHDVTVILIQDGVFVGKKEQKPAEYPNQLEYLENAIEEGLKVIVCGVCCGARGIKQEDLADGCQIVGMHEIVQACAESDNTLTF